MNEPSAPTPQLTVIDVIREVFRNFAGFAEQHLARPGPPAILVMIWLLGMDAVAGAIELEYVQRGQYPLDNWFHVWLRIMGLGLAVGVARYWIVGTLFHVVVRLAGGNGPLRTSRYIFLYAAIPVTVVELCVKVVQMLYYGNRYFTGQTSEMFDALTVGVVLGAYVLTARLCYIGLRVLTGADRLRSILAIVTIGATVAALVATMAV